MVSIPRYSRSSWNFSSIRVLRSAMSRIVARTTSASFSVRMKRIHLVRSIASVRHSGAVAGRLQSWSIQALNSSDSIGGGPREAAGHQAEHQRRVVGVGVQPVVVVEQAFALQKPFAGVPGAGEADLGRVENLDPSLSQMRSRGFPQPGPGLHPHREHRVGQRVVAVVHRVEDRVGEPVVRRAVGVAEPLDAQLADAAGQLLRVFSPAALRSSSASSTTAVSWSDGSSLKISLAERCLFSSLAVAPTACFSLSGGGHVLPPRWVCRRSRMAVVIIGSLPALCVLRPSAPRRRFRSGGRRASGAFPGPTRRRRSSPNPARWSNRDERGAYVRGSLNLSREA